MLSSLEPDQTLRYNNLLVNGYSNKTKIRTCTGYVVSDHGILKHSLYGTENWPLRCKQCRSWSEVASRYTVAGLGLHSLSIVFMLSFFNHVASHNTFFLYKFPPFWVNPSQTFIYCDASPRHRGIELFASTFDWICVGETGRRQFPSMHLPRGMMNHVGKSICLLFLNCVGSNRSHNHASFSGVVSKPLNHNPTIDSF